jgi:peptide/nickel transport system permease protein
MAGTSIAFVVGTLLGLIAGYFGGRSDGLIMRTADMQLSFPALLIALVLLALMGPGLGKVVAALAAVQWAYFARTARSAALVERRKDYVTAAQLLGLSTPRIMLRHLLPNCLPPLLTVLPLQIAAAVSLEATLSFLGLGAPVTEPSLGLLIANGFQYLNSGKYWISVFPGIALLMAIAAINLVGERMEQMLQREQT